MKEFIEKISVDKIKDTFYSGGNLCTSSCGTYIFCVCGSTINVIESASGSIFTSITCEDEEITCICLSPDDKYLISAHRNLLLKQWNWKEKQCIRTWKAIHTAPIQCMSFDQTSTLLATGSSDFTCKIWDINAQYCTHNLKGAQGLLKQIKFYQTAKSIHVYTASEDCKIRVYDLNKSELIGTLESHFSAINCIEFSNDLTQLFSASGDNVIIVWDVNTYKPIKTIPVYESIESIVVLPAQKFTKDSFSNIEFDPDSCVLTFGSDGLIKIWNWKLSRLIYKQNETHSFKIIKQKEELNVKQVIIQALYQKGLDKLILVTVDKLIAFIKFDKTRIFEFEKQFIGDHGEILDIALCNKEGSMIAIATNSEMIKIYNEDTWNCDLLRGHTDIVICLSSYFRNDDCYLASSSKDNSIRLWKFNEETRKFVCVAVGVGHTHDVGAISFTKLSSSSLVSASIDTTLKLWKINRKTNDKSCMDYELQVKFTQKAHDKDINSVCVSPNDKLIATGSTDRTAKLWDLSDGACLAVLRGHKRGIWCVQFSPTDQIVATSSADTTIKLWSINDFSCVRTFEGHTSSILKLAFLNNGTQMISASSDGLVKLWNIKTNTCLNTYDEHKDKIWALAVNSTETKYLTGGSDSQLIIWKDITDELHEEEMQKREEVLINEQQLENCLVEKKYKKALQLAIKLDRPFKCYEITCEILSNEVGGVEDLRQVLFKLRDDQLDTIVKYAAEWNTNTKFCHVAQVIFEILLRNAEPERLMKINNFSNIIEQFLPYSERHYSRMNKLMQQIMFVDFAWSNMKLSETDTNNINGK